MRWLVAAGGRRRSSDRFLKTYYYVWHATLSLVYGTLSHSHTHTHTFPPSFSPEPQVYHATCYHESALSPLSPTTATNARGVDETPAANTRKRKPMNHFAGSDPKRR